MKAFLAILVAALALAACGSGDGLAGCTSCHCNCGGSTIDGSVQGMPICDCAVWCRNECHGTPVSSSCVGPVKDVASCAN